jgi:amidase
MERNHKIVLNRILKVFFILLLLQFPINQTTGKTMKPVKDNFGLLEKDITQIEQGYKERKFTVKEVVQAYLDRIKKLDVNGPALHSILVVNPDAMKIAAALDNELKQSKTVRGPLFGIPVVLKDNIDTHDKMPCTAGSRALKNSYPLKDSYVAAKLRAAGAVIIGKTNLSEWANFRGQLSISGWSGEGGLTKNPYILSRNPCGSSSGSAVAVSANLTAIAIGTETDGSIVCPSQANGIVGIKPTVGLISRTGVIPISSTQDTPGPMGRTVRDVALCLGALTGIDSMDVKTLANTGHFLSDYTPFLKKDGLKGKRIGLFKAPFGINYKVDKLMYRAVNFLKSQGAEIIEIDKITNPKTDQYSNEIMLYEYKEGLNNYFRSLGTNAPVKNIDELIAFNKADSIELRYFNQHYLEQASKKGDLNSNEYREALANLLKGSREEGIDSVMNVHKLDAIMAPTGSPAWISDLINGDSFQIGTSSPSAQAGYPDITVPMGFVDELPVGISFFGKAWSEPVLLEIAYAYEQGTHYRKAPGFLKEE